MENRGGKRPGSGRKKRSEEQDVINLLDKHIDRDIVTLKLAELIKKGVMAVPITPTYENEYCSVAWLDYSEKLLQELSSSFLT